MADNHLVDSMSQPDPIHNYLPASWDLVIEDARIIGADKTTVALAVKDMRGRDEFGFAKYKTRIQPRNGRDNLVDAYQEALDLCVYLRSELYELQEAGDGAVDELQEVYDAALVNAISIRSFIYARDGK